MSSVHPYDGCPDCLEATAQRLRVAFEACGMVPGPVTKAELERHAKRFGPALVAETAKELGVELEVEAPKRKRGARGPSLRDRVAAHVKAGRGVELIAELEQLTPTRARRLVEEVQG